MADLTAVPGLTPVPQIETTTQLLGGPGGPMNQQAQALLNRIEFDKPTYATKSALAAAAGSADVGFTQGLTGSVSRTTQSKLRELISVKDFGAVGDGVADDTAAIQACINAVSAKTTKGMVWIPSGKYKITTNLSVPYGVSIRGDGGTASEILCFGCDGLRFSSYGYEIGAMAFENFGLTASSGTNFAAIVTLSNAQTMDGLHFDGMRFYGWNECFNFAANWNCSIHRCTAQNINAFVATSGVLVGLRIVNNRAVHGAGGAGTAAKVGIDLRSGTIQESIQILNNYIYGFNVCVQSPLSLFVNILHNDLSALVTVISYTTANGILNIAHNYIEAFGVGISGAAQSVDTPTTKTNIKDNVFVGQNGTATIGIQLNTAAGTYQFNTSIEDNSFSGFITHDIKLFAPGRTRVANNRMMSNVTTDSLFVGGVIAGPVRVIDNWLKKALYSDVPADITSGKLVLDRNTVSDLFVPSKGTWTPVYEPATGAFGTIVYGGNTGSYERIGNLCFFNMTIFQNTHTAGTATGALQIGGLPFTAASGQPSPVSVGDTRLWGTNTPSQAQVQNGTTKIGLYTRTTANGANATTPVTDMVAGTTGPYNLITISGVYLCA